MHYLRGDKRGNEENASFFETHDQYIPSHFENYAFAVQGPEIDMKYRINKRNSEYFGSPGCSQTY